MFLMPFKCVPLSGLFIFLTFLPANDGALLSIFRFIDILVPRPKRAHTHTHYCKSCSFVRTGRPISRYLQTRESSTRCELYVALFCRSLTPNICSTESITQKNTWLQERLVSLISGPATRFDLTVVNFDTETSENRSSAGEAHRTNAQGCLVVSQSRSEQNDVTSLHVQHTKFSGTTSDNTIPSQNPALNAIPIKLSETSTYRGLKWCFIAV
ncbi:hypothetical protein EVAR_53315_1 [Eumeta japonica]|uniref:Uncharacterized protein n=1 Tax=Eumeta variegata TaxID=151549 RepID=A0A4C1X8E6_EUMVA|nr:hypothetical protein EVAR_53315_1 [Eumeta japonica]